ncbi:MAG: hypothetical protein Q4E51_06950 [Lachnospiraceae bacterium]|nr:hypothetical protein [Lachnospiraceae bacterium]
MKCKYHLPGLFEFYELYKLFLPMYFEHREYFYDWCDIGSIYGAPADCLWGGGRVGYGDENAYEVISLMDEYNISARLTFSNSLIKEEHLSDKKCNRLLEMFSKSNVSTGIIIYSDLLMNYIKEKYSDFYFISSTTKVITDFDRLLEELKCDDYKYVVPDFRLNKSIEKLRELPSKLKDKVEFLCNECCDYGCVNRKACYENVSRLSLGEEIKEHKCSGNNVGDGYRFSKAMENPGFISIDDIKNTYMPMGYSNFKIEGRSLGSALILEFLLYYMTKPEYQIHVREGIYLDNMLYLF